MVDYDDRIRVPRFKAKHGYFTDSSRSITMSKIRGKNSKAELKLRKGLWKRNIRFRIHPVFIPGKPDIFIQKYRLVIFVDGDFWHGYNWSRKRERLKSNTSFWIPKIERNMQRDIEINKLLTDRGYTVMRFWENQINKEFTKCINQVLLYVESSKDGPVPLRDSLI